MKGKS